MTLMTNDINDLQDDIGIENYLTILRVRNTAEGRAWQSGSFKAGKSERLKSTKSSRRKTK